MSCAHQFFLEDFHSNATAIERQTKGDPWTVICQHCQEPIAGSSKPHGPRISVRWSLDHGTWFGTFTIQDNTP